MNEATIEDEDGIEALVQETSDLKKSVEVELTDISSDLKKSPEVTLSTNAPCAGCRAVPFSCWDCLSCAGCCVCTAAYTPSPEEIARECAAIRETWDARTLILRGGGNPDAVYSIPTATTRGRCAEPVEG